MHISIKKTPEAEIISTSFGTGKPEADTLGQANKWLLLHPVAASHYLKKKFLIHLFH